MGRNWSILTESKYDYNSRKQEYTHTEQIELQQKEITLHSHRANKIKRKQEYTHTQQKGLQQEGIGANSDGANSTSIKAELRAHSHRANRITIGGNRNILRQSKYDQNSKKQKQSHTEQIGL